MKINNIISNLLFPPKCANCNELLDIKLNEKNRDALCPTCRLYYENEKQRECNICGLSMEFCRCMPKNMEKAQCTALLKLISYRTNDDSFKIRNLIYSIKHKDYAVSFDFIAEQKGKRVYIQAAYLLADESVIEREFNAYAKIDDNFPKYVITMDKRTISRNGIVHYNLLDFLLGKVEL